MRLLSLCFLVGISTFSFGARTLSLEKLSVAMGSDFYKVDDTAENKVCYVSTSTSDGHAMQCFDKGVEVKPLPSDKKND